MMIDIHCHIMPGVDDGSGNMSDSTEMAQLAYKSGTKKIIVTPHCNVDPHRRNFWDSEMESRFLSLQAQLRLKNIPVEIFRGQEIFLSGGFIDGLRQGRFITLNGSAYVLAELDFRESAPNAYSKLHRLASEGYVPVVAHPERYEFVQEQHDAIYKIKETGSLIQVNKGSLKGSFGFHAQKKSFEIIDTRQADFIAGDAHSQYSRTPVLADVHEFICERFSSEYADFLVKHNPQRVLDNERIYGY
ncbi:MAG: hypothetical protein IJO03_08275 [Clostridia bacterium]|nr:hypothetical protein [Clostridia bacterium]